MSTFNDPGTNQGIDLNELEGSLLLFTVYEETEEMVTVHGPTTAMRVDCVVLDGDLKGEPYDDILIFPRVLKGQLRKSAGGGMVLGRLGKGAKQPGKNAPWTLNAADDAEKATAQAWVDSHGSPAEAEAEAESLRPF